MRGLSFVFVDVFTDGFPHGLEYTGRAGEVDTCEVRICEANVTDQRGRWRIRD